MKRIGTSYRITYTPKELKYRLFGKKRCPNCGNKLISRLDKHYRGRGRSGTRMGPRYRADIYGCTQAYYCKECRKVYEISELAI